MGDIGEIEVDHHPPLHSSIASVAAHADPRGRRGASPLDMAGMAVATAATNTKQAPSHTASTMPLDPAVGVGVGVHPHSHSHSHPHSHLSEALLGGDVAAGVGINLNLGLGGGIGAGDMVGGMGAVSFGAVVEALNGTSVGTLNGPIGLTVDDNQYHERATQSLAKSAAGATSTGVAVTDGLAIMGGGAIGSALSSTARGVGVLGGGVGAVFAGTGQSVAGARLNGHHQFDLHDVAAEAPQPHHVAKRARTTGPADPASTDGTASVGMGAAAAGDIAGGAVAVSGTAECGGLVAASGDAHSVITNSEANGAGGGVEGAESIVGIRGVSVAGATSGGMNGVNGGTKVGVGTGGDASKERVKPNHPKPPGPKWGLKWEEHEDESLRRGGCTGWSGALRICSLHLRARPHARHTCPPRASTQTCALSLAYGTLLPELNTHD